MEGGLRGFVLGSILLAGACAPQAPRETPEAILARAIAAQPADARVAQLYAGACRTCHTNADSGAPLTLDRAAWDRRWSKGEDTLVTHTLSGFNGMPAGGQCFSCTVADHRALIAFMAGRGS